MTDAVAATCPGHKSPVNPSRVLRLCLDCERHAFAAEALAPAARRTAGQAWACVKFVRKDCAQ